jgi:hypothetical protein
VQNAFRSSGWFYQLAAVLIFIASLALVNANVEAGMNDDWSFVATARALSATGHLHYNGWSAPLIGFQAYWAALFLKIFGFSFLAARASVWIMAVLAIPVLWQLLRMADLRPPQAFFGVLFFLLSPLVLPHVTTFMTDLPAFFLFAAALLCALKAWESESDGKALLWMAATVACGILSGSIRQIYWLSGVCFLTVLSFARFRSVRGRACALIGILTTVVFGAAASYWLAHQPYVPVDDTLQVLKKMLLADAAEPLRDAVRDLTGLTVVCLPLTLPLALLELRRIRLWTQCLIVAAAVAIPYFLANPLPWIGNTLTNYGVITSGGISFGDKPVVLSGPLMIALAALSLASAAYSGFNIRRHPPAGRFLVLTAPFLLLYTLVIFGRSPAQGVYDRYSIPYLFVAATLLLVVQSKQSQRLSRVTLAGGAVFLLYALATTHDYFAEARARLEATQQVLRAGNKPTSVLSGLEFNSWAQIEWTGHVNNEKLQFPPNSYHQIDDCSGPDDTLEWWRSLTPDVAAPYVVTLTHINGLQPSGFAPVEYWRWLPLGRYHVYVEQVEKGSPALTCKPDTGS